MSHSSGSSFGTQGWRQKTLRRADPSLLGPACRSNNNIADWKEFERLKELPKLTDLLLGEDNHPFVPEPPSPT